ncbi:B3/B4 domain-containing protein [Cytobacillus purgationiresistens]|uniref:DNA/RNA-binding domain of Phe-tRNA-synthetase-like protein n=1 Tax=Cytobacillus purgationiresistens TaxID=863449 RepID=A0ABU0AR58_9BACI|nr:phenylalanine--tRNA ligase beta subunit-related protein [Cytobacillus purgationiresistens]MDQ0273766.1 DNA/RNA-binding domain of Phe-tRNA-synthetase-like protein [Cytobacillus purgationiresistens]
MEISISPKLCALFPQMKVGIIRYRDIVVESSPQMIKGRLQLFQESLFFDLEEKNVTDLDGIKEWRQIFKKAGKDPNRYRHSAEALYRRVKKQNFLQSVNSSTDINNFFSLKYQIPLGIYDSNKIVGDIVLRLGEENEEYYGINGRSNSLHNLILLSDEQGPFGSPFVDSARSSVSEDTSNAVQVVFLRHSIAPSEAQEMIESLKTMFLQVHGGTAEIEIRGC